MKQIYSCCYLLLGCFSFLSAQVGIGTTSPNASAALDITSTTTGMLIPTMTSGQRTGIGPAVSAEGLLVYQTDATSGFYYWDGAAWQTFGGGAAGWALTGNAGTTAGTNFVGTTDGQGLSLRTNGTERIRVDTSQEIGIGTATPSELLHIVGTSPVFRFQDGNETNNYVLTSDANGDASWQAAPGGGADGDWTFLSGSTVADPIYHTGGVVIGKTGTTTHTLLVDDGSGSTTIGIGNTETISDGGTAIVMNCDVKGGGFGFVDFGNASFRWNTAWDQSVPRIMSDPKKMRHINTITYGLDEILQLNPVSYNWKEERVGALTLPNNKKGLKLGFIAQEVLEVIPEIVNTHDYMLRDGEGSGYVYKERETIGMNYDALVPVLVKAKQEQDIQMSELQARLSELQNKVIQLTKK